MSFWESQPGAYTLDGEPRFIYTLIWDDFRIRSLHLAPAATDERTIRVAALRAQQFEADSDGGYAKNMDEFTDD